MTDSFSPIIEKGTELSEPKLEKMSLEHDIKINDDNKDNKSDIFDQLDACCNGCFFCGACLLLCNSH